MIAYKYKLYQTKRTKHLDAMLREASFVWNHALALQKRYYSLFGKYISKNAMQKHYAKRIKRTLLHSQTTQEIIERLDTAYQRFFKKLAKRPPKFRRAIDFYSIVYKQGGFSLNGNVLTVNTIKKRFKFSYSRPYEGRVKRIAIKRSRLGEYYLIITTDAEPKAYGKTHDGASVGIDFGLKTYMTLSDGTTVRNPQFLKSDLDNANPARYPSVRKVQTTDSADARMCAASLRTSLTNARIFSGSSHMSCAANMIISSLKIYRCSA